MIGKKINSVFFPILSSFLKKENKREKGAAVLPTILLFGGIAVEIGITGVLIALFLSQGSLGAKLSEEALAAANSGIEEGVLKIVRDKDYNSISSSTLSVGDRSSVEFFICKDIVSCGGTGKHTIYSIGSALNKRRKVNALIATDSITGEVKIEYIKEVSL
ncbi:hypothetical protein A2999_01685 [Candidatus Wolfebacteria bacterium RIFCSPLOWO2_01_FULL_38_11]|uniref:TadE family protein n=2 Tax=Candidatus Wolfeibacteriota TaxID=1752735 RepID=A0A0G0GAL3_9BACT|nr:MAG: hypothetical protein US36_C0005G0036 [Candidatus Wolfebacteria bacterium GW2011_GWC1_37_10]OGM92160.1 MAG: hypothetical protein A2999_01685 [Candidatus Wolfebacteria bacterium RIFCSPLOWO2_01_FULL_38_11]